MYMTEFYDNRMASVKEFIFNIEDAKITVLSDKGVEYAEENVLDAKYGQLHFHVYYELFYVNEGKITIVFENEKREFEKDDLIIVTPETNHITLTTEPGTYRYNINFLMEKISVKSDFSIYDALKDSFLDSYVCVKGNKEFGDLLKRMVIDIMQGDGVLLSLHFHELAIKLLEKRGHHQGVALAKHTISDSNMIRMYKLQQIIFTSYWQDISLDYIAEKMFLSVRQVSRIIKQYYGCTYRELVAKNRMKVASELLEKTDLSILDIAAQTGYTSIKGFYTYFKKEFNCLPTEYRKRAKKNKN